MGKTQSLKIGEISICAAPARVRSLVSLALGRQGAPDSLKLLDHILCLGAIAASVREGDVKVSIKSYREMRFKA